MNKDNANTEITGVPDQWVVVKCVAPVREGSWTKRGYFCAVLLKDLNKDNIIMMDDRAWFRVVAFDPTENADKAYSFAEQKNRVERGEFQPKKIQKAEVKKEVKAEVKPPEVKKEVSLPPENSAIYREMVKEMNRKMSEVSDPNVVEQTEEERLAAIFNGTTG